MVRNVGSKPWCHVIGGFCVWLVLQQNNQKYAVGVSVLQIWYILPLYRWLLGNINTYYNHHLSGGTALISGHFRQVVALWFDKHFIVVSPCQNLSGKTAPTYDHFWQVVFVCRQNRHSVLTGVVP